MLMEEDKNFQVLEESIQEALQTVFAGRLASIQREDLGKGHYQLEIDLQDGEKGFILQVDGSDLLLSWGGMTSLVLENADHLDFQGFLNLFEELAFYLDHPSASRTDILNLPLTPITAELKVRLIQRKINQLFPKQARFSQTETLLDGDEIRRLSFWATFSDYKSLLSFEVIVTETDWHFGQIKPFTRLLDDLYSQLLFDHFPLKDRELTRGLQFMREYLDHFLYPDDKGYQVISGRQSLISVRQGDSLPSRSSLLQELTGLLSLRAKVVERRQQLQALQARPLAKKEPSISKKRTKTSPPSLSRQEQESLYLGLQKVISLQMLLALFLFVAAIALEIYMAQAEYPSYKVTLYRLGAQLHSFAIPLVGLFLFVISPTLMKLNALIKENPALIRVKRKGVKPPSEQLVWTGFALLLVLLLATIDVSSRKPEPTVKLDSSQVSSYQSINQKMREIENSSRIKIVEDTLSAIRESSQTEVGVPD